MSNAQLAKYKERIGRYEDTQNPLAPLTQNQRQFILDLTHTEIQRAVPSHLTPLTQLRSITVKDQSVQGQGAGGAADTVDWKKFNFSSKNEFNEWFEQVQKQLENDQDKDILEYSSSLRNCKQKTGELLTQVSGILDELKTLQDNYHFVSNKTSALHNNCQQLIEEQAKLESVSKEIESHLSYFVKLEKIATKLSSPNLLITSDSFFSVLEEIDSCLSFMIHNPTFKESNTYGAKYKHCLNKGISLVKSHITKHLQETTSTVTSIVQSQTAEQTDKEGMNIFPLIYGNFSAGIAKLKRLFTEIENRRNGLPEYAELFNEIQLAFFRERTNLLNGSVWGTVTELNTRGKTGIDLCSTVRMGCSFCINLCQDEFRLYGDFFSNSYTVVFDEYMERLCNPIYDTLRPLIIKIQHLETLAELCSILRIEMLEEQVSTNPMGLNSFIHIVEQLLQDTQERLVYRASIYISTDIRNYNPGPGDLAYPEKLQMMEQIAETLDQNIDAHKPLVRSNSQTSVVSLSSVTSQEVANINSASLQIPRPLKAATSPADLHGMWFPSVRRTLLCLSKLYRCLDKAIFQGLSQEALTACIANVSLSAEAIAIKKTIVDAQLFEIKHLLILREQIAPFQVDFAVKEMSLDFSRVKIAALSLLQKKKQLFSLGSNNALLEFIVDGTPQVKESFLDSKKEVDRQLKLTCEKFILHSTEILISALRGFLTKAQKVIEAQKEKPEIVLSVQSFALPNLVAELIQHTIENLKSKLPFIHRSMKLYLANRETEFILFRPIKNNVLNGFLQLENIVVVHYSGTGIVCPSQDHMNALISSVMIQT